MKVIQGKYKGVILKGFDIKGTRPTMDRVKESLFATIQNKIKDSIVLDLFAGSGNLGIESLSMGAKNVIFVDKNKESIKIIRENLLKINENRKIINADYKAALKELSEMKFDIIFLDPPYDTNYIAESIKLIEKYDMLEDNGLIVCESDKYEKIYIPEKLEEYKNKKYGEKIVVILKK